MRRVAAVVGIVLIVIGAVGGSAGAVRPVRTGWWERSVGSVVPTPPPAPVPAGGMRVASSLDGPTAVSALRYELGQDAVPRRLTLTVAAVRGTPVVVACRAASAWQPANGGPMGDAPQAACAAGAATGVPNADGTKLAFDVTALGDGPILDVVLQPGADSSGLPVSPGFDVVFAAPDDAALAAATRPSSAAALTPTTATGTDFPAEAFPPLTGTAPPPAIAPPSMPTAPSTKPLAVDQLKPAIVSSDVAKRPGVLGLVLLASGLAVLVLSVVGNPSRFAWALGGTRRADSEDTTIAGLDRWAKPRHGSPPGI